MALDLPEDKATEYVRRADKLRSDRSNLDRTYQEIARYVLPRADDFLQVSNYRIGPMAGQRRDQFIFDATAQLALPAFAAAIESMVCPRTQKYQGLKPASPRVKVDLATEAYLEDMRDLIFQVRYSPRANFASQVSEVFMSMGAFGTGALFIEDGMSKGILYRSVPLSQLYLLEDAWGNIDTVFWRYPLTARQAKQRWPQGLPENIEKVLETDPEKVFEFLHIVEPNANRQYGDKSYRGMRFSACDVSVEGKKLLGEGGYRTMPFAISRYTIAPGEVYGRSPAWDALADIKTVNEMSKTSLRYGQLVTDPPWLTASVDAMNPFSVRPGAINAGYLNERGEKLAVSAAPQGDPRIGLELMDQRRQAINRAFLVTLFQILVETPEMTATEAMLRAQEKGALLAPTMGRQQSEFLGTITEREIDILSNAGVFDDALGPMPEPLAEAGGALRIEYDSPLTRAQRSEEAVGTLRTLETAGTVAQYDASILNEFHFGRAMKVVSDANGAPVSIFKTDQEKQAAAEQQAQQQQLQLALQAAPVIADTAKTAAEAQKVSTEAPF